MSITLARAILNHWGRSNGQCNLSQYCLCERSPGGYVKQTTLVDKGRLPDKDVYFCTYALEEGREIRVIVNGPTFVGLKKEFNCDLEKVTRLALEQALESGIKGNEVHLTGKTYLAVRKKLGA